MSWKRHLLLAVVLVALGVGALLGFVLTGRGSEQTFVDDLVFIPTVVGKSERQAIAAIEAAGLNAEIRYERRIRDGRGRVIGQVQPSRRFTSKGNWIAIIVARP